MALVAQIDKEYSEELQTFCKRYPDLSGKYYDLDGDDKWIRCKLLSDMVSDDLLIVYMTKDISPAVLLNTYFVLG